MRYVNSIVIHCSDSSHGNVMRVNDWHKERGFDSVGYHFVICNGYDFSDQFIKAKDGAIESGRSLEIAGAHAKGHNSKSIGICMIAKDSYTPKQILSLKVLVSDLMLEYGVKKTDIIGHREISGVSKTCPTGFDLDKFRREL